MIDTYRNLFKDGISNARLNLLDLLQRSSLVQAPDEEIDITGGRKLLVIVFAIGHLVNSMQMQAKARAYRRAFLEVLYLAGTGRSGVTTELPAATTLLQSRSAREDSENKLKFFLKS